MRPPCRIANCPALCLDTGPYCAAHAAMTDEECAAATLDAENATQGRPLQPVTTRIEYES